MAQVITEQWTVQQRADNYLGILFGIWESIPEIAAEWDEEWDDYSRLDFDAEWGSYEDKLHSLNRIAQQGLLTPEQQVRYDELTGLIAEHRPTLERLLNEY